ncbi:MAG: hypothetical protein PWP34_1893 [Desulfuromonadales bacterium]|nr:hypothetical protein [Desulfuromonadales bacterium]
MHHGDLELGGFRFAALFQFDETVDVGEVLLPAQVSHAGFVGFPADAVKAHMQAVETAVNEAHAHFLVEIGGVGVDLGARLIRFAVADVADQIGQARIGQRLVHQIGADAFDRVLYRFVDDPSEQVFIHLPHGQLALNALVGAELAAGIATRLSLDLKNPGKVGDRPLTTQAPAQGLKNAVAVPGNIISVCHDKDSFSMQ